MDVVVPCYQEEEVIPDTIPRLVDLLRSYVDREDIGLGRFRILLVDDGSRDRTWEKISDLDLKYREVDGIKLSRNYGHQIALLAGLASADADACLSIDADLQDDIEVIADMLLAFENGNDLALGVRKTRDQDTFFKRNTALGYYRLLYWLGVRVISNHADFRLVSRRALAALLSHNEVNLFLRGIIPTLGFKMALIPYARKARTAGETKYTMRKMLHLAIDGITSFSTTPLRIVAVLGGVVFSLSVIAAFYVLFMRVFHPEETVAGWASTLLPIVMLGGLEILSIGVLGEYVGKIYLEVKRRPRFFVDQSTIRNSITESTRTLFEEPVERISTPPAALYPVLNGSEPVLSASSEL